MISLFFLLLLINPLQGDEPLPAGGQRVEKVQIEQKESKEVRNAKELLEIKTSLTRDALASDVVGERPDPDGTPTQVKVGMFVTDIMRIDDNKQHFTANIRITARWIDPRLADPNAPEIRKKALDDIWNPILLLINQENVTKNLKDSAFLDRNGHVLYAQRYIGTFTVPLNLRNFPLDQHKLFIKLRSFYSPSELQLIIDEGLTGWSETLSIPDWIVSNGEAKIDSVYSKGHNKQSSESVFMFNIERRLGFYLWKIIIPLSLIVLMSWGVFWIDPNRLEAQIGLSATTFLTLFAFQFAIAALLPKISYLTRMDRFTMLCSILVFLALIEAITTSYYVKNDKLKTAINLDRFSRVAFPLAFAGTWYLAFWY